MSGLTYGCPEPAFRASEKGVPGLVLFISTELKYILRHKFAGS